MHMYYIYVYIHTYFVLQLICSIVNYLPIFCMSQQRRAVARDSLLAAVLPYAH